MKARAFFLAVSLTASACSYSIVGPPFHPVAIPQGTGIIYVYRPDSSKGMVYAMPIFVDGLPLGALFRAGYVPFHVRPGTHTVKIVVAGTRVHEVQVSVEPGADAYVRYDVLFADTALTPVPVAQGREEIRGSFLLPGGYDGRDRVGDDAVAQSVSDVSAPPPPVQAPPAPAPPAAPAAAPTEAAAARPQPASPAPGSAGPSPADASFREGKRLLEQGRFAEACPKLEESYRLDPATGALLALAVCHEDQGKLATAYGEYAKVAARSKDEARKDRARAAREKMAAIEPRLSTLAISVPSGSDVAGLRVRRDGEEVPAASWGDSVPVDGGQHFVEATAPGRKSWRVSVSIRKEADKQSVDVPALEGEEERPRPASPPLVASSPPPPAPEPVSPVAATTSRQFEPVPSANEAPPDGGGRRSSGLKVTGLVFTSAGVVALGVGLGFGIEALMKKNDYESESGCQYTCPDLRAANTMGNLSTGFVIGGAAVAAAGLTMVLLSPRRHEETTALRFGVVRVAGAWQMGVGGSF